MSGVGNGVRECSRWAHAPNRERWRCIWGIERSRWPKRGRDQRIPLPCVLYSDVQREGTCSSHMTNKASNRLRTKPPSSCSPRPVLPRQAFSSYPVGLLIPRKSPGTSRNPGSFTPAEHRDSDQWGMRPHSRGLLHSLLHHILECESGLNVRAGKFLGLGLGPTLSVLS